MRLVAGAFAGLSIDPSYYKGEHPDAQNVANALKIASIASLPFGGVGGLLEVYRDWEVF